MNSIKHISYTISLFLPILFFCTYSFFDVQYAGVEKSSSYVFAHILMGIVVFFIFMKTFLSKKLLLNIKFIWILLFLFLLVSVYYLDKPNCDYGKRILLYFFSSSFFGILIGVDLACNKELFSLAKWIELLMVVITIMLLFNLPKMLGDKALGIGSSHQTLAYYSAFMYCINLFFILFGNKFENRFSFFSKKLYKIISYLFLLTQVISCFSSGGRGGAVLLIFGTIILLFKAKKRLKNRKAFIYLFISLTFIYIVYQILPSDIHRLIDNGLERTFSYLSFDGIDMTHTSNRDIVYSNAMHDISMSPFWGYGFFSYLDLSGSYPHNFFLEILLQGGIIYLSIILILFVLLIKKMILLLKTNNILILPLILYPFVMLFFSGTYITTMLFWFTITYMYFTPKNKNKIL